MAVAKGMSTGYAHLGAILVTDETCEALRARSGKFVHAHTYGGNPLAGAAGAAVMNMIQREGLVENARGEARELLGLPRRR